MKTLRLILLYPTCDWCIVACLCRVPLALVFVVIMVGKNKKKKITIKRVAKEIAVGVRVCCSNVTFEPSEQMKSDGVDKLLGKAEGTVAGYEVKSQQWFVKFDKMEGMQKKHDGP